MSFIMPLNLDPKFDDPDGFYNELIRMHDDLSESKSREVNARLILLLANHIGDRAVLSEAMRIAREPLDHRTRFDSL